MATIPYKSFCWSLGTTSFRTKNFNKNIEEQLALLNEFWTLEENQDASWAANLKLQSRYYDFMQLKGFIEGGASNKPKDAREKTSGIVDIGLINKERKLTAVGQKLLQISKSNDFTADNFFQIPRDSYIYLKQLLKTYNSINREIVRPFLVLLRVLSRVGSLSLDEYTYLLPMCTSSIYTEKIILGIEQIRLGNKKTIDDIILGRLMEMNNYRVALDLLLSSNVDEALLCEIGLNRKSRSYDKAYLPLYNHLYSVYVNNDTSALSLAYKATRAVKIGKLWRNYLFNTSSETAISRTPNACKKKTLFDSVTNENDFKEAFFKIMHLFKAKATLSDYLDLNRRYIKTTDIILFEDNNVKLDIVPKHFFNSVADELYSEAYNKTDLLCEDRSLEEISACLVVDAPAVINSVNIELGTNVTTIDEARVVLEDNRYARLQHLIDSKFTDENILTLLYCFERRDDTEIRNMVTDNADVPTIFEYVLGLLWYKISERQGKLLDYLKLSLDADLLPKTHAGGGEADIVYEYAETEHYPAHALLLEATLADSTNQRRMEMEPVSRHLGNHLIRTGNSDSYCVFATNFLNINVISDFRGRKHMRYYDSQDHTKSVIGMKIIPLQTSELKQIVIKQKKYKELYSIFEKAYNLTLPPHEWYDLFVQM